MKEIQPIVYPLNAGTATLLNCTGQDNFNTSVYIYYQLLTSSQLQLQQGNLTMDGFDYEAYNTSPNGNEYIYNWTAQKLGVTLV
jgi:hypothetical protein